VHSPEESETDPEKPNGKRQINVYNYSWRSDEVILFFFAKCHFLAGYLFVYSEFYSLTIY
jgi:hypothetical protein